MKPAALETFNRLNLQDIFNMHPVDLFIESSNCIFFSHTAPDTGKKEESLYSSFVYEMLSCDYRTAAYGLWYNTRPT